MPDISEPPRQREALLLIMPEEGEILKKDDLEKLIPAINRKCRLFPTISEDKLVFPEDEYVLESVFTYDTDPMSKRLKLLNDRIKEAAIIEQSPGYGPAIRHRIFNFEIVNNSIEVKFTQIYQFDYQTMIDYLNTH